VPGLSRVSFFSILWCSHTGDRSQEELVKFLLRVVKEENRTQIKYIALCFDNLLEPTYIVETWKFEKFFPQILVTLAHNFFHKNHFYVSHWIIFCHQVVIFFSKEKCWATAVFMKMYCKTFSTYVEPTCQVLFGWRYIVKKQC
jgi:hypothetical protein